jgi:hypothetical protein
MCNGRTLNTIQMQWTLPQEGHVQESPKQKTSSQEEHITSNVQEEAGKEGYQGDPYRRMEQGKSLLVSSVESWVTSHETAGKSNTLPKDCPAPDKHTMKK